MEERPSIRYVVPKEGGTIWADCLVVLKSAPQKDLALRFIDFLLDPKVAARTTNGFCSPRPPVRSLVETAFRHNPAIYPPDDLLGRLEWMRDVGKAVRVYDRAWTELKMH